MANGWQRSPNGPPRRAVVGTMLLAVCLVACTAPPTTVPTNGGDETVAKRPTSRKTSTGASPSSGGSGPLIPASASVAPPNGGTETSPQPSGSPGSDASTAPTTGASATPTGSPSASASPGETTSPSPSPVVSTAPAPTPTPPLLTTLAGSGTAGDDDGQGAAASFSEPAAIGYVQATDMIVVVDTGNHRVRHVTRAGMVSTLAGEGGIGADDASDPRAATFNRPAGLAVAPDAIYIADTGNHRIRKLGLTGGNVTSVSTLAGTAEGFLDGPGAAAAFKSPRGLAYDETKKLLYVADSGNRRIRVIDTQGADHTVTTIAGTGLPGNADGTGTAATFFEPMAVAWDGFLLFVIDRLDGRIRQVLVNEGTAATAQVLSYSGAIDPGYEDAGQGAGRYDFSAAGGGLCVGPTMNLFIAESGNQRIRLHTDTLGSRTLAGAGERAEGAAVAGLFRDGPTLAGPVEDRGRFHNPLGVIYVGDGKAGKVYVADTANHRIRVFDPGALPDPTAGGDGPPVLPSQAP